MSDYSDLEVSPEAVLTRGVIEADRTFVDAERFRFAMRAFATGVVIVTVEVDDTIWGLTINSCCSISASPPQVLISLARSASCRDALLRTRRFGLSILAAGQRELAELGAVPGGPKQVDAFSERPGEDGPAMIAGALAHLDCRVNETFEVSDHTLVIGRVGQTVVGAGDPLLYFNRSFHRLGRRLDESEGA